MRLLFGEPAAVSLERTVLSSASICGKAITCHRLSSAASSRRPQSPCGVIAAATKTLVYGTARSRRTYEVAAARVCRESPEPLRRRRPSPRHCPGQSAGPNGPSVTGDRRVLLRHRWSAGRRAAHPRLSGSRCVHAQREHFGRRQHVGVQIRGGLTSAHIPMVAHCRQVRGRPPGRFQRYDERTIAQVRGPPSGRMYSAVTSKPRRW